MSAHSHSRPGQHQPDRAMLAMMQTGEGGGSRMTAAECASNAGPVITCLKISIGGAGLCCIQDVQPGESTQEDYRADVPHNDARAAVRKPQNRSVSATMSGILLSNDPACCLQGVGFSRAIHHRLTDIWSASSHCPARLAHCASAQEYYKR